MQLKRLNEWVSSVLDMGPKKGRRSECSIEIFISFFTLFRNEWDFSNLMT